MNIESVAQLCVEYWKLTAATEKALNGVPASDAKRLRAQLKFSKRQFDVLLQDLGLRLVEFSGERFRPGLPVSVDHPGDHEEHAEDNGLVIDKTLEPAIVTSDMTVIRRGRVSVAPAAQAEE